MSFGEPHDTRCRKIGLAAAVGAVHGERVVGDEQKLVADLRIVQALATRISRLLVRDVAATASPVGAEAIGDGGVDRSQAKRGRRDAHATIVEDRRPFCWRDSAIAFVAAIAARHAPDVAEPRPGDE